MPRDSNGFYTLPLNPVVDGDIIEAEWANTTAGDLAVQMNNIMTRDGLLGPTEPLLLINGSVLAPSLAFNTQNSLGFFRDSINAIGVAIGGMSAFKFSDISNDTFKPFGIQDGTVTAPSLRFTSEVDTGFYKVSPGVVALVTLGVERMRWDDKGNISNTIPVGTMLDFAGVTAPFGYLVCNGDAVSRTTYAALFAVIGTTWGVGNGSTTFNLPDLRRRTTIGVGGTVVSGPNNWLAAVGGAETTALATTNIPSHAHTINDQLHSHATTVSGNTGTVSSDHTHNFTTSAVGDHQHIAGVPGDNGAFYGLADMWPGLQNGKGGTVAYRYSYWTSGAGGHEHTGVTGWINQNHSHTWSGTFGSNNAWAGINGTNATGSGTAFNNMQPSVVVNKIIKI